MIKELVVISGKGGTGKTSLAASFAVLAVRSVIADCDVDAADLHLVLSPEVKKKHTFKSGHEAVIRSDKCNGCGVCMELCRFDAIRKSVWEPITLNPGFGRRNVRSSRVEVYSVDPAACEGCGVCVRFCPKKAIDFPERVCGDWMVSETRCGPMVHARLGAAAENSGKLVSTVRREARKIALEKNHSLILVDGPPGIGCPVIASLTGATQVLAVTEPTVSGEHDLERVLALAKHFNIPSKVCVNKWDLNPEMADRIEKKARKAGAAIAGRVRYDNAVTQAQMLEKAVVETEAPSSEDVRKVWENLGL